MPPEWPRTNDPSDGRGSVLLEQLGESITRHGPTEQEALYLIAAYFSEHGELVFGFDALRDSAHAKGVRERDDRGDEGFAEGVVRQATDEGAVDFQRVDRQVG